MVVAGVWVVNHTGGESITCDESHDEDLLSEVEEGPGLGDEELVGVGLVPAVLHVNGKGVRLRC